MASLNFASGFWVQISKVYGVTVRCLSWRQLTSRENTAVSEEGHVLTAYVFFFLAVSVASMQIKSSWDPFSKIKLSGLKLKIYIFMIQVHDQQGQQ